LKYHNNIDLVQKKVDEIESLRVFINQNSNVFEL